MVLSQIFNGKEAVMGKSLNGKELGKNICQRKDGINMARMYLKCMILKLIMVRVRFL
jgi:hypothetical protein